MLAEIIGDLGGADLLSEGQRQLARRCATIAIACEKMEGEAAAGNEIDLDVYGQLTDRLGRVFHRLGLKRQPRDVTPSLAEYLATAATRTPTACCDSISRGEQISRASRMCRRRRFRPLRF